MRPAAAAAAALFAALVAVATGEAQAPRLTTLAVVVLVDTSGSMSEDDGTGRIKIDGAKAALQSFLEGVEEGTPIGLRTYPDQSSSSSCNTGTVRFKVQPRNPAHMAATIRELQPDGDTPTAEALRAAAGDLRASGHSQGTLVLVSDGLSTCAPPCDVAKELAASGIDIETITIGFRISPEGQEELRCIAGALDGEYIDVDDSKGLQQAFERISRPAIEIDLEYPREVTAEVGNDPRGLVRVNATVRNNSKQLARNVVVRLRFDANAPGLSRPVLALGNLEADAVRELTWAFRPGQILAGKTVVFTVVGRAENSLSDTKLSGSIMINDRTQANDAGPILRDRKLVAILGDSYSSGEGADVYLAGTDTDENACHRSRFTYLVVAFALPDHSIIACSGAVTKDIGSPQAENHVEAQADQLRALEDVDAVVLTIAGNDAGFGTIARSCLLAPRDCSKDIVVSSPFKGFHVNSQKYVDERLNSEFSQHMMDAYRVVNGVLNSKQAVTRRGSVAPILALAYPSPIPLTDRPCPALFDKLTTAEVQFISRFATRLNGLVEGATIGARERLVPVFFVPNTEEALQPDHTVCDRVPYARGITSFNNADVDVDSVLARIDQPGGVAVAEWQRFKRGLKELMHPNQAGYKAVTRAVIRWSLSHEAKLAQDYLAHAEPADEGPGRWKRSNVDLGQLEHGTIFNLQGGTSYELTEHGFAPYSPIEIRLRSEPRFLGLVDADEHGTVHATIAIPRDFTAGRHTIEIEGIDRSGAPRTVRIPVRVREPSWPWQIWAIVIAAALLGPPALALWIALALTRGQGYQPRVGAANP